MQTLHEIRDALAAADLAPRRRLGQCFLIDGNLMAKLLDLAELTGTETVLEVGAATGSLTEELLERAARAVAVEIDRGLFGVLAERLAGREGLTLLHGDALAGKHAVSDEVLAACRPAAHLVANLPYGIATPLIAECLLGSWRALRGDPDACRFDRLTFTVQHEVAERLAAGPDTGDYGPVSVHVALLGRLSLGPAVPPTAFWPRPKVRSRILRIDFDADAAGRIQDAGALARLLAAAFGHRRKQIGTIAKRSSLPFGPDRFAAALAAAGVDLHWRAENVSPAQYLAAANALAERAD